MKKKSTSANIFQKKKTEDTNCDQRLSVKYTYRRQIIGLHGKKNATIKVLAYENKPEEHIYFQNGTATPLIPKCEIDINMIVLIGLLRWRLGMKRHEIRGFLETKGIFLSTGTITNRSLDFLLLFKQLHMNKIQQIKALIERKGGIILHMDGTHRSGGRVVFVLQEGIDNIVINADLIPSEAEEHIDHVLLNFKNSYGSPLVIVRDMAKGIIVIRCFFNN